MQVNKAHLGSRWSASLPPLLIHSFRISPLALWNKILHMKHWHLDGVQPMALIISGIVCLTVYVSVYTIHLPTGLVAPWWVGLFCIHLLFSGCSLLLPSAQNNAEFKFELNDSLCVFKVFCTTPQSPLPSLDFWLPRECEGIAVVHSSLHVPAGYVFFGCAWHCTHLNKTVVSDLAELTVQCHSSPPGSLWEL